MNPKRLVTLLVITIFLIGVTGILLFLPTQERKDVNSFESCAEAGNPVMESYPRQCKTPDGKVFIETVPTPTPGQHPIIDFMPLEYSTPSAGFIIEEEKNVIIRSQKEWHEVFGEEVEPPNVDFNTKTVLGVFAGARLSGGYFVKFQRIENAGNKLNVYVSIQGPGEGCVATQALTYPYDLVFISKTDKEISYKINDELIDCIVTPTSAIE